MPTYLVTITVPCEPADYTVKAGTLLNSLSTVMSDPVQMESVIGEFDSSDSEVGVQYEDDQAVARIVVRITSEARANFDKSKLTNALKATGLDAFKLRKQAMPDDDVARAIAPTEDQSSAPTEDQSFCDPA